MEHHHLQTRRKDKGVIELICRECHKTIHGLWTNPQLRDSRLELDTVDGLRRDDRFNKAISFIRKIKPGEYMKMRESRNRRRR